MLKNNPEKPSKFSTDSAKDFQKQAEEIALQRANKPPVKIEPLSPDEKLLHLHNLQVQQIELELQNEELRRIQIDLEESRERYFELYNLAPVGYCSIAESGMIIEANLTLAMLLGVNKGSLDGKPLGNYIYQEDQNIYYLHRKLLFKTGEPQICEMRMLKKDGTKFWANMEAILVKQGNGPLACRTSISDITKRKEAEQLLKYAKDELELKVAERTSELATANAYLQSFANRMVQVLEEEKKGIARDLHDQVGQSLTVLNLMINQASRQKSEKANQTLAEAQKVISDLIGQIREISLNLRPSMLDDLGLLPALTWHIERYEKRTRIKVIFNHNGLERNFTRPIAETVYRVVQEALTNVARYAAVDEVQIDAWADNSHLTIMVKDSGRGFDPAKVAGTGSFGLRGMSERLFAVGGTFKVDSEPGSGTTLQAIIPLNEDSDCNNLPAK